MSGLFARAGGTGNDPEGRRPRGFRTARGLAFVVVGVLIAQMAYAQEGRFRGGLGLAFFMAPAYPGSDSERLFVYPYPYWDYRSKVLDLRHEHLHAKLAPESRISVGFGANGSPPLAAGSPDARIGMPALWPTFALGPDVRYRSPWQPWGLRVFVGLETRLRTALGPDLQLSRAGTSAAGFGEIRSPHGAPWPFSISVSPVWRSRSANNYFFGVSPAYAIVGRPAYEAPGGYAGLRVTGAITARHKNMSFTIFARYRNYSGTAFLGSPLLKTSNTLVLGVAVVWAFLRSWP